MSGVRIQGDLCSKVSVMSENIQVCGVLVSVWNGRVKWCQDKACEGDCRG